MWMFAGLKIAAGALLLDPAGMAERRGWLCLCAFSWTLVIAAQDPGHPNWLSTAGHRKGVIFFRWFLADELPPNPVAIVERA